MELPQTCLITASLSPRCNKRKPKELWSRAVAVFGTTPFCCANAPSTHRGCLLRLAASSSCTERVRWRSASHGQVVLHTWRKGSFSHRPSHGIRVRPHLPARGTWVPCLHPRAACCHRDQSQVLRAQAPATLVEAPVTLGAVRLQESLGRSALSAHRSGPAYSFKVWMQSCTAKLTISTLRGWAATAEGRSSRRNSSRANQRGHGAVGSRSRNSTKPMPPLQSQYCRLLGYHRRSTVMRCALVLVRRRLRCWRMVYRSRTITTCGR